MTGSTARSAAVLVGLLWTAAASAAPDVTATVDSRRIPSDGTVRFRITVQGKDIGDVSPPSLSDVASWSLINGPSISSQFRFVNGVSSTSRTFSWVLAPSGPGKLTIPSVVLDVNGQREVTNPVTVQVYEAGGPAGDSTTQLDDPRPARLPAEEVFLRAILEPDAPYVGQQTVLRYDLYTRVEVASVPQAQETPVYPNFWKEDLDGPQRITPRIETVDGREYHVYTVRKVALFPTASGETTLPPMTFSVPIKSQRTTGFRRSFFFDPVETVYKRAPPVTVQVRPLPVEGRPEDFSNAVGQFDLNAVADRTTAETGEGIGLSVSIEGTGNLNSVKEPALVVPGAFTVYPPEMRQSISPDRNDHFTGVKTWKYVLVPREPGSQELPEVRFSYFDPEAEAYRTLVAGNITVSITGEALIEDIGAGSPTHRAIERLGSDIHFIHTGSGALSMSDRPAYRARWFWLALLVPPLANVGTFVVRWQRRRYISRFDVVRRRRARRSALRRLKSAGAAVADENDLRFYGALAQAMTGYVADKFDGQASGLTYDRIAALLATNPRSEKASREFLDALEACDCARFAPGADQRAAREQLLERAQRAILSLEGAL